MSPRGGGGFGKTPSQNRASAGREIVTNRPDYDFEDAAQEVDGTTSGATFAAISGANNGSEATKLPIGSKIVIPGTPPPITLSGKSPTDLTVIVGNREIKVQSAKIVRAMDMMSDAWSARIPWTPGQDRELDRVTRPYGYERAAAYIGNDMLVNGRLYTVSPSMTDKGMTKELKGYSFTVDAVDSSVHPTPARTYEMYKITLQDIAKYYAGLLGVDVIFEWNPGGPFDRVSMAATETIFQLLVRLATERGGLVSCTEYGDILFTSADSVSQKPIGTLMEDQSFVTGWKATYDGRKRFHAYRCITQGLKGRVAPSATFAAITEATTSGQKGGPPVDVTLDAAVPIFRTQTFHADNVTPGNIKNASKWRKNKQFADSLTIPLPVTSWYGPDGKLWRWGTMVTVISKTLGVGNGFDFLIRSVEFDLDDNKRTATIHLIPPQAYSDREIGEIWTYS